MSVDQIGIHIPKQIAMQKVLADGLPEPFALRAGVLS